MSVFKPFSTVAIIILSYNTEQMTLHMQTQDVIKELEALRTNDSVICDARCS